jgi:hypothetical protein
MEGTTITTSWDNVHTFDTEIAELLENIIYQELFIFHQILRLSQMV